MLCHVFIVLHPYLIDGGFEFIKVRSDRHTSITISMDLRSDLTGAHPKPVGLLFFRLMEQAIDCNPVPRKMIIGGQKQHMIDG